MAHAQKPDFVFRRNGRIHLNWPSVQSTTGSRVVRISGSNAGYTMFRGGVKSTGYPLHSTFFPSLPLPCVTVCHHISTGLYTRTPFLEHRYFHSSVIMCRSLQCADYSNMFLAVNYSQNSLVHIVIRLPDVHRRNRGWIAVKDKKFCYRKRPEPLCSVHRVLGPRR
jgi:hypothetical protein